jgi:hypothetical protein
VYHLVANMFNTDGYDDNLDLVSSRTEEENTEKKEE